MPPIPKISPEIAGLLGLGATVAVSVGGGTLLGHWAGTSWGFEPWGTLAGSGLGIASAGLAVVRAVKRLDAGSTRKSDDG
jgi:F0F1-type ATP synthase assembly protein I